MYGNIVLEYPEISSPEFREFVADACERIKKEKETYGTKFWKTLFLSPIWGNLGSSSLTNKKGIPRKCSKIHNPKLYQNIYDRAFDVMEELKNNLEIQGIHVIYTNTDGLFIQIPEENNSRFPF